MSLMLNFLILGDDLNDKLNIVNNISNINKFFDIYIPDVDEPFMKYVYKNCSFTICPYSADIYKNINNDIFKNIYGVILCYNDKSTIKNINILQNYTKLFNNSKYKIMINLSSNNDIIFFNYGYYNYTLKTFLDQLDYIIESCNYKYSFLPSCELL